MKIMLFAAGGDIGGGKTHILSLARELSEDNHLKLLSFRKGVLADEGREMGLDVIDMDNGWNILTDLKMALRAVDAFSPDVIHCHGAKANMMGVIVKKLRHIPVMTTVHSDPKLDYMGMPVKQYTFCLLYTSQPGVGDFRLGIHLVYRSSGTPGGEPGRSHQRCGCSCEAASYPGFGGGNRLCRGL